MSIVPRRYTYVDFTSTKPPAIFAKTTGAIRTAADNQENFWTVDGKYFEQIQTGAGTLLASTGYTHTADGWLIPMDAATDGCEITQGMTAGVTTPMKFVVGTDAFFIKVKFEVTTLANFAHFGVGFRELGAYSNIGTAAEAITAYAEKVMMKAVVTTGAVSSTTSVGGSDTNTAATGTPLVSGTAVEWGVFVDSDGVCTFTVDGTADTLLDAGAANTLADATVVVPSVSMCGNATGASNVQLVSYECGLQKS